MAERVADLLGEPEQQDTVESLLGEAPQTADALLGPEPKKDMAKEPWRQEAKQRIAALQGGTTQQKDIDKSGEPVWKNVDIPMTEKLMTGFSNVTKAAGVGRVKGIIDQAWGALTAPKINDTTARGLGFDSAQEYNEHTERVAKERIYQGMSTFEKNTGKTIGSLVSIGADLMAARGPGALAAGSGLVPKAALTAMSTNKWARLAKMSVEGAGFMAGYEALRQVADEGGINSPEEVLYWGLGGAVGAPLLNKVIRVGGNLIASKNSEAVLATLEKQTQKAVRNGKAPQAAFDEALSKSGYTSEEIASYVGTTKRGTGWVNEMPPVTQEALNRSVFGKAAEVVFSPAVSALRVGKAGADFLIKPISSRMEELSPPLLNWMRKNILQSNLYKQDLLDRYGELNKVTDALPRSMRTPFWRALNNGDAKAVDEIVNSVPSDKLTQTKSIVQDARKLMSDLLKQERAHGIEVTERANYWPRVVKEGHVSKLRKTLGSDDISAYQEMMRDAVANNGGKNLTRVQEEALMERFLRGTSSVTPGPGFTKARRVGTVTDELAQHYLDPYTSGLRRIERHVYAISRRKFFGKHMQSPELDATGQESTTSYTLDLIKRGELYAKDMDKARKLLDAFMGYQPTHRHLQAVKNIFYASKIGQFTSGLTQIGDVGIAGYVNGIHNSIRGTFNAMGKKSIDPMRSLGLQHYAEEFASTGKTATMLDNSLKWSLFKQFDLLGKRVHINGAMVKNQRLTSGKGLLGERNMRQFRKKWTPYFGKETDGLIRDLQKGEFSDNVRLLMFNELSAVQPISLLEMPEGYLRAPTGRVFYALKTFGLKQLDLLRREAIGEIKRGNPIKGATNLARYTFFVTAANGTAEQAKNFISGRKVDFTDWQWSYMMKQLMMSEYLVDQLKSGNRESEAIAQQVISTPVGMAEMGFHVYHDLAKTADGTLSLKTSETLTDLPVVGRTFSNLLGEGYTKYHKRREKEMYGDDEDDNE